MTHSKNNYFLGFIILVGFILFTIIYNLSFIENKPTFGFAIINKTYETNRKFISSQNKKGYDNSIFEKHSNTTMSNFTKSSHLDGPEIKTEAGSTISTRYYKLTAQLIDYSCIHRTKCIIVK